MGGEILAARSGDDEVQLLRCLRASAALPPDQLERLAKESGAAGQFIDALYNALREEDVQELLHERFRENLFRFLGAAREIAFEPVDAVFVPNIQIGHDSRALLDDLAILRDSARPVQGSRAPLLPGTVAASGASGLQVVELCRNGTTVSELMRRSAREPNRILQDVIDLLNAGALKWDSYPPPSGKQADGGGPVRDSAPLPAASARVEDEPDLDAFGDYDTTRGEGTFTGLRDVVDLDGSQAEERHGDGWQAPAAASEAVELPEATAAASATAVSLNFSGPRFGDDDARKKLEVLNDVLEAVSTAVDAKIGGAGTGQARVQLLIDGSSGTFAALFNNVELRSDGRLPVELVLKNLRKRPGTEHRRLLQRAATDLIERALSLASEDLSDELMEQVLEKVAGYQQRLGI